VAAARKVLSEKTAVRKTAYGKTASAQQAKRADASSPRSSRISLARNTRPISSPMALTTMPARMVLGTTKPTMWTSSG
jgi:hypothetical protein